MTNLDQDLLNSHVVLRKAIHIIENRLDRIEQPNADLIGSYLSDRMLYLNHYVNQPMLPVPRHVFQSASNVFRAIALAYRNKTNEEHCIMLDINQELKRLSRRQK